MLEIVNKIADAVTILAPVGRIDATSAPNFESACLDVLESGVRVVILDFSRLQYISSAGLRSVLLIGKRLREQAGALRIANLSGVVAQVFELSGITDLFPTYDSITAAVNAPAESIEVHQMGAKRH